MSFGFGTHDSLSLACPSDPTTRFGSTRTKLHAICDRHQSPLSLGFGMSHLAALSFPSSYRAVSDWTYTVSVSTALGASEV